MPGPGIIFDMDGTLVDSGLDFAAMRCEMGLPDGEPLLEAIAELPDAQARRCWQILERHESEGADRATLIEGVSEFLAELHRRRWPTAVLTRNSREMTAATLRRFGLRFDTVMTRDDGPIKPDPASIHAICAKWNLHPNQAVMIGDYRFDIEAGRRAGTRTVLYTKGRDPADIPYAAGADYVLRSFFDYRELLAIGLDPANDPCS